MHTSRSARRGKSEVRAMRHLTLIDRKIAGRAILLSGLVLSAAVCPMQSRAQDAGRVFALLAIDTDSKVAGVEDDGRAMSSILVNGFGHTGILNLRVLTGPDVRPDVIVDYFRNVPAGPNDVLLIYYSGHGATFEGQGHFLTTSHGNLSRRHAPCGAQRTTSATERAVDGLLCQPGQRAPTTSGARRCSPQPRVSPMMRHCLLLQHRGIVDVNSSSFGEMSWASQGPGGDFHHAPARAMGAWDIALFDTDRDGFVTWTELFDQVRHETQTAFREFRKHLLNLDPARLDRGMRDEFAKAARPGASGIRPR